MRTAIVVFIATALSTTAANAIPSFAPTASSGWFAYTREFLAPPGGGPGPVMQDKRYPRVTNDDFRATGKQPTNAIGDTTNPILQPWAADVIRKFNAQALAGKPVISQHAECRAIGVTNFILEPMTRPIFIEETSSP